MPEAPTPPNGATASSLTVWSSMWTRPAVVGRDLPGHGGDRWAPSPDLTMEDLAHRLLEEVDGSFEDRAGAGLRHAVAGRRVGGAVVRGGLRGPSAGLASGLLHALSDSDDAAYAAVCGALAGFDARDRLGEVRAPVLAVAGAEDVATPPSLLETACSTWAPRRPRTRSTRT